jgi:hypothetical protein
LTSFTQKPRRRSTKSGGGWPAPWTGIRSAATLNSTSSVCPGPRKGNWTISLRSVAPDALWEASDIVADIQEAYDLAVAA